VTGPGRAPAEAVHPLAGIDSFPYRTRVETVMSTPVVRIDAGTALAAAAQRMAEEHISSVLVDSADGGGPGIVTERDLLRAVAGDGGAALGAPVARYMSRPLATVAADDLVYVALGRMDRLAIRHLAVTGPDGAVVGMVSARTLLKLRAGTALAIGDAIAVAPDSAAIAAERARLPNLARALRADGMGGLAVAAVISATIRDATRRAGELAQAAMRAEGLGEAPAPFALLVLGSAGRGESLLVPDQDNALVHGGDAEDDPWFAEFGRRVADILDGAGIPYCKGGVMAREAGWRRPLGAWEAAVAGWIRAKQGEALLNVDIFFDLRVVLGDPALGEALRRSAIARAAAAPLFLHLLGEQLASMRPPLGFFGGIRTEGGLVDLKKGGTMPVVSAARTGALAVGSAETSTPARLAALVAAGRLDEEEGDGLAEALETIVAAILDDQLARIAAGEAPSTRVRVSGLGRARRRLLAEALGRLSALPEMVQGAIASR